MKSTQTLILGIGTLSSFFSCSTNDAGAGDKQSAATESRKPNILFCIADDATYYHFSANGCTWVNTPGYDRIAREGLRFTNAYTPNAKCAPSRASILTGRNSWQLEEAGNHIGFWPQNKYQTYPETLAKNGYFVGFTGKPWAPGNMGQLNGKPRQLNGLAFQTDRLVPPTKFIDKNNYAANFRQFLSEKPADTPWCFWYGSTEPHREYEYGTGVSIGGKNPAQIDQVPGFWPDNDTVRNDMLDYAFELEYFDRHLEEMLNILGELGELENTIVVVTADNGMPFPRCKGLQYEYSNHMPLAIMWKAGIKNPGRTIGEYVSFVDLAPTFVSAAGIEWETSGMESTAGRDLSDIFADKPATDRSYILLGQERHDYGRPMNQGYPIRSVLENGFLYSYTFKPELWPAGNPETGYLNTDGSPTKSNILNMRRSGIDWNYWSLNFGKHPQEELYKVSSDRECLVNLAGLPEYAELQTKMKAKLFAELEKQGDPRISGNGDVFDRYPFFQESSFDYWERYTSGQITKWQTNWVNPGDYERESLE